MYKKVADKKTYRVCLLGENNKSYKEFDDKSLAEAFVEDMKSDNFLWIILEEYTDEVFEMTRGGVTKQKVEIGGWSSRVELQKIDLR